jgi:hypothetical protein
VCLIHLCLTLDSLSRRYDYLTRVFFRVETVCLDRLVLFLGGPILPASKRATFGLLMESITNKMQGGPLMSVTRRLKRPRPRWLLVPVLTAWLSVPAQAQAPAQTQRSTQNSSEVAFQVGIKDGKSQFYLGEVIPLELTFTSKMPKRYQINMARYDRSGRMSYEQFLLNPDGRWGDPLRSYFNSSMGWMGGGLTGFEFLSERPTKISLELNEWVQFHRAGKYRVTVQTSRVGQISGEASSPFDKPISLTSNELELTIVAPTTSWQEQTLVQALAALDASAQDPAKAVANPAEPSPRHQALKTLRYLGTASAAKELARHLRGEDTNFDFECMFGLVGSPQHEAALSEMRRLLADPDHPVTELFLVTMSVLSLNKDESPELLRPQREQRYQAIHAEFLDDLQHKRGNALAVSLYTALNQVGPQQAIPREENEQLAAQLPAIFDRLPVEKQYELLAYRWDSLRSPALLPLLRTYARTYQDFPIPNEIHAYNANNLSGTALLHWYELVPEEARAAVIQEILRPKPRFNAQILGILPDKTLPEVEQTLIEHFSSNDEDYWISANLASLIQRYATAAILPRMLAIVDTNVGKWACAIQEPALAYLLRVDPVAARSRIEAGIAARGEGYSACNHSLLAQVGTLHLDPLLEEIALRSLNDDDPEVAANAAGFLGRFGSAATEENLWERLAQWSARWHGRESELIYIAGGTNPNVYQGTLGTSLQQAISSGEAWLADKAKLQKLQQLSVGTAMRQPIDGILAQWDHNPWRIQFLHFLSGPQFDVLQYHLESLDSLRNKLSQFPLGSSFVWSEASATPSAEGAKNFVELSHFLKAHGMSLRNETVP